MTDPDEKVVAGSKLQELMETPDTEIKRLPDGGIRVGKAISLWERIKSSWVNRLQAITGSCATIILAIPQDQFVAVIPMKYVAYGVLAYTILTFLARMRSI